MDTNNVPMYSSSSSSSGVSATITTTPSSSSSIINNMNVVDHILNNGSAYNSLMNIGSGVEVGGGGGGGVGILGQAPMADGPRTLYVGNLDSAITEKFLETLFGGFGSITGLKLFNESLNEVYCFIEYDKHSSANAALQMMNKRKCLEREMKVNWASNSSPAGNKLDTSKHYHVFVGDLSPEVEAKQLRDAFGVFGEISDCRVVRDPHTLKSKGYGFVVFVKKEDAENAINSMNGQWLGHRPIRTNWASRKFYNVRNETPIGPTGGNRNLNYEEVYNQSSPNNLTVYCGGIMNGLSEDIIQKMFGRFGNIQEIRVFKDKGYAFIKFTCKEAATNAIVSMHNSEIFGQTIKCSWGKEPIDSNMPAAPGTTPLAQTLAAAAAAASAASAAPLMYPYNQQLPYWYPYNPGLQPNHQPPYATVQAAAAAAGMQYSYNQYYPASGAVSTSQSNAFNSTSLQAMPISNAWTHHQSQHQQLSNNNNSIPASHMIHQPPPPPPPAPPSSSMQQPTALLNAYSMQGYQHAQ